MLQLDRYNIPAPVISGLIVAGVATLARRQDLVGAFFIDFTNALLITACLNLWR